MVPETRLRQMPALDGLRAAAVAAVLLYHGDVAWARGGYLGVDAFFVLSGFLITSLLLVEWRRTGGIALPQFWRRRARRLLPALFLVLGAVETGHDDGIRQRRDDVGRRLEQVQSRGGGRALAGRGARAASRRNPASLTHA